ncbi:MAG: hypothetical protein FJ087_16750 [Deltaproteobacteria bacterium]|nr:hypothetical protein [Deltaproteobacteria bacterium]
MPFCSKCGADTAVDDSFCRRCGADLNARPGDAVEVRAAPGTPGEPRAGGQARNKPLLWAIAGVANVFVVVGLLTVLGGKGCGHSEGSLVATGKPLGDFVLTPTQCRSGQRTGFFGVALVGDGPTEGGVLVVADPVNGRSLKIEVPGSCKPPDYDACTEIAIKPEQCSTFDVRVERTSTTVNDIVLLDGHAKVECAFPEGGTAKADFRFENCN